jgi:integrase
MKTQLTDASVRRLKAPAAGQQDHWDKLQPGFGLRIGFGGTRTWLVNVRILKEGQWRQTRIALGRFPPMSLAEAREKARLILQTAREGKNPRRVAMEDKAALEAASRHTLRALSADFIAQQKLRGRRTSTVSGYQAALQGRHVSDWQDLAVSSISRADVRERLLALAEKTPVQSNRFRAHWSKFFGWCVEQDFIETSPMAGIKALVTERSRERVLAPDEIAALLGILDESKSVMAPVFRLLLLTGQRRSEISDLRWSEVKDLEGAESRIELPGERTKNHRPHVIPLSPQAVATLKGVSRFALVSEGGQSQLSEYVFSESGKSPVSGFSKFKAQLDHQMKAKLGRELLRWTVHDLRRTAATAMNDTLGADPHVVEAVLNHISGASKAGVAGTYNRAAYLTQRRAALNAWANYLDSLVGKQGVENVVMLQRGKGA